MTEIRIESGEAFKYFPKTLKLGSYNKQSRNVIRLKLFENWFSVFLYLDGNELKKKKWEKIWTTPGQLLF